MPTWPAWRAPFGIGAVLVMVGSTSGSVELIEDASWIANGYDVTRFDTYRIYFDWDDPAAIVNAVYGNSADPMSFSSSTGVFHNDLEHDSLTAPVDMTDFGVWSNQWDSYVTIDTTTAFGDGTALTPGFDAQVGGLTGSFVADQAAWLLPSPSPWQGIVGFDHRLLIAQLTVAEGASIDWTINVHLGGGLQIIGLTGTTVPAPAIAPLLGLAALRPARRRSGHPVARSRRGGRCWRRGCARP